LARFPITLGRSVRATFIRAWIDDQKPNSNGCVFRGWYRADGRVAPRAGDGTGCFGVFQCDPRSCASLRDKSQKARCSWSCRMTHVEAADFVTLVMLSLPVAAIAWTVTHEELFREFHDYCVDRSEHASSFAVRKFFYLFTCEYCFSHYVSAGGRGERPFR